MVPVNMDRLEPNLALAALRVIVLLLTRRSGDGVVLRVPESSTAGKMLKAKVKELAKHGCGSVGLMAVGAFEVLRQPSKYYLMPEYSLLTGNAADEHIHDLKFSNILAYLASTLRLDVEESKTGGYNDNNGDHLPLPNVATGKRLILCAVLLLTRDRIILDR